jgi:hypothetical protein
MTTRGSRATGGATISSGAMMKANGDGRYTTATGGTMMRHDSGKGQQGDRMHNDFDGRHDDDKGQQGNRWHDDGDERAG